MTKWKIEEKPSEFNSNTSYWHVSKKEGWLGTWWFETLFDTFEQAHRFVQKRIKMKDNVHYYD